ncbi:MAG: DUF6781 family protein [Methylomonas sp.]
MSETNQLQAVEDEIRESVQSGSDIHQKIKTITLKALTDRQLDMENIKNVAEAVSKGINTGVNSQSVHAREIFGQAVSALDDALAVAVEAWKLAIEEAASKVNDYSQHELQGASNDLENMENVFLNSFEKLAEGNQLISEIARDFIAHSRHSGTVVGKQALTALEKLKKLPHLGKETVISGAVGATITLAELGSGILSGIADSLKTSHSKK